LILAVPALWVWRNPSLADLARFALVGSLGVVAHTMLAHAFARIEAARLAPVTYVTLVWGAAFGFLFFAEVPGLALPSSAPASSYSARCSHGAERSYAACRRP
jgi:S-adenosylmethionine uptake transporter